MREPRSLALPHTTITLAQVVAAGQFTQPGAAGRGAARGPAPAVSPVPGRVTLGSAALGLGMDGGRTRPAFTELPAFCRIAATLKPSPTSDIRIEVWLPATGWNGKFRGTGPNGLGGNIAYASMGAALRDGFATASSDTGHQGNDTAWTRDPERMKDFGTRAAHEMTVAGKSLTEAFYGASIRLSYMSECGGASTAAMSELQYPGDYNGIIIGGFAGYWTHQTFAQMWAWMATHETDASFIPPAKYPVIHDAVLQACDMLDGVKDGLLEDPTRCMWDPKAIECVGNVDGPNCLTTPQVEAVRKIYAGPVNPRTKQPVHSPLFRGSELDWELAVGGMNAIAAPNFFRNFVFRDPMRDFVKNPVNYDSDVALADRPEIAVVNAFNPDITKFVAGGGKVILAGGWGNAIVPPGAIIDYYKNASARLGARATQSAARLYMVPGMSECNGGPGTDTFDMFAVMQRWVEQKQAPKEVIASRVEDGKVVRTRPLCPYPTVSTYKGKGSTDEAVNFVCK